MEKDGFLKSLFMGRWGAAIWGAASVLATLKGVELTDGDHSMVAAMLANGDIFITGAYSVACALISKLRNR